MPWLTASGADGTAQTLERVRNLVSRPSSRENTPPRSGRWLGLAEFDGERNGDLRRQTEASDQAVTANYVERHIKIGIEALKLVRRRGRSVKHLRFEDDFDAGPET
jgi:hypothetical protein